MIKWERNWCSPDKPINYYALSGWNIIRNSFLFISRANKQSGRNSGKIKCDDGLFVCPCVVIVVYGAGKPCFLGTARIHLRTEFFHLI